MILVELNRLSYCYETSIYAVDRVNGTMYSKFDVGYRMINEKTTVKPQFKPTSLEDEYNIMQPPYVNTLPGTTSMVTPIAKSTPMTQASQMSTPMTQASQMQGMKNVRLPSGMPSLEDGVSVGPESL